MLILYNAKILGANLYREKRTGEQGVHFHPRVKPRGFPVHFYNIPVGNMDPGACINFKSGAWKRGITNRVDSYEALPMAKEYPLRMYGAPKHLLHSAVESTPEKEQHASQNTCKVIMFPRKDWRK